MRLLLLLCCVCLASSCTSTAPNACTGDGTCDGGRCVAGACYSKGCGATACTLAQVCVAGACADEQCVGKSCDLGSVCLKGNCLPTSCGGSPCPGNQVCEPTLNQCVDTSCVGVLCPQGQTCNLGQCLGGTTCGGSTCAAGQACVSDQCRAVCGTTVCGAQQACDLGQCTELTCVGVRCDGGACQAGQCTFSDAGSLCGATTCTSGQVCDVNRCVEPACVGVHCDGGTCVAGSCVDVLCQGVSCDGGVCQQGQCYDACQLSCASPCPECQNGRTCGAGLECVSRRCEGNVCVACTGNAECPNGGVCQSGICRSGLLGPCASTLDCKPGSPTLVCDHGLCRLPLNGNCTSDAECIASLRCENLVCQRPKCLLQLVETQQVPPTSGPSQAMALQPTGELYATVGQWSSGSPSNTNVRRYRVSPGGDAGIVEQQPTMAPLLTVPTIYLIQGHSDSAGTATMSDNVTFPRRFHWVQGGGAFDGRESVTIEFSGFNADVFPNFTNIGRMAKCGDNFYFAGQSSMTASGRVLLRFHTPNPVGSGTTAQLLTASAARRDNNVFPSFNDLNCTATALFVVGVQGGQELLQRLDPLTLADVGAPVALSPIAAEAGVGDLNLAVVDDSYLYVVGVRGEAFQFWDGGTVNLGNTNFGTVVSGGLNYNANGQGLVIHTPDARLHRYARRLMNGTEPPPDLDCQWQ